MIRANRFARIALRIARATKLKGIFGGSLKITSENNFFFEAKTSLKRFLGFLPTLFAVFHHDEVPENSPGPSMGRFPCLALMGRVMIYNQFARIDSQTKKKPIFITCERVARIASNLRVAIFSPPKRDSQKKASVREP